MNEEDLKATKIQVQVLEEILNYKDKEIERLHSIIKEVREYIKENTVSFYTNLEQTEESFELIGDPKELLEILDKVGDDKE